MVRKRICSLRVKKRVLAAGVERGSGARFCGGQSDKKRRFIAANTERRNQIGKVRNRGSIWRFHSVRKTIEKSIQSPSSGVYRDSLGGSSFASFLQTHTCWKNTINTALIQAWRGLLQWSIQAYSEILFLLHFTEAKAIQFTRSPFFRLILPK